MNNTNDEAASEFEEWWANEMRAKEIVCRKNGLDPDLIENKPTKEHAEWIWQASRTATLKEILEALPNNKTLEESEFTEHSGTFNECVAEIRAIIEKKLESV